MSKNAKIQLPNATLDKKNCHSSIVLQKLPKASLLLGQGIILLGFTRRSTMVSHAKFPVSEWKYATPQRFLRR